MTQPHNGDERIPTSVSPASDAEIDLSEDDLPEDVPPKAWVTLVMFAAFVVAFGTCASAYLFN